MKAYITKYAAKAAKYINKAERNGSLGVQS